MTDSRTCYKGEGGRVVTQWVGRMAEKQEGNLDSLMKRRRNGEVVERKEVQLVRRNQKYGWII